jgi:hypothetical protein
MKRIMTGEFTWQDSDNLPVVAAILSASEGIAKLGGKTGENLDKAKGKIVRDSAEAILMFTGMPALAVSETFDLAKGAIEAANE